jgi:Queuine tRNA-ribosyltransferase
LLAKREAELAEFAYPAGEMYTGAQHLRLMEGVKLLRQKLGREVIDVAIASAGYGLIAEDRVIAPYEVTFNTMKVAEVDAWAKHLGMHATLEKIVRDYDLVFLLLGENYLRSLTLPIKTNPEKTFIFFASKSSVKIIPELTERTYILPLSNSEAKHFSYGLVGLKGFLFKQFAEVVTKESNWLERVYEHPDKLTYALGNDNGQLQLPLEAPPQNGKPFLELKKAQPKLISDKNAKFLAIPDVPPAPNLHLGMQYFIPEWDDRVDPGYDFLADKLTPNRDPYKDEVYAHEIFAKPNYDGILVSKVVVESSKAKRQQIEAVGIHEFVRFSGKIMGDCGAFGYIKESVPPFNTDEILDYYQTLDFDFGVSIDHLIVGPFAEAGVREQRYDLTIQNAREFLDKHREGHYTFTPIGAVQGWSPETYAAAVKEYVKMGYDYIALGGLVRSQTKEIVEVLKAVSPHLTSNIVPEVDGSQ